MSELKTIEALKVDSAWKSNVIRIQSAIILLLLGQKVDLLAVLQGILK